MCSWLLPIKVWLQAVAGFSAAVSDPKNWSKAPTLDTQLLMVKMCPLWPCYHWHLHCGCNHHQGWLHNCHNQKTKYISKQQWDLPPSWINGMETCATGRKQHQSKHISQSIIDGIMQLYATQEKWCLFGQFFVGWPQCQSLWHHWGRMMKRPWQHCWSCVFYTIPQHKVPVYPFYGHHHQPARLEWTICPLVQSQTKF